MVDRDTVVQAVAGVLKEWWKLDGYVVESDDDLDTLGAGVDSLEYVALMAEVERRLGVKLPAESTIVGDATLSELVDRLMDVAAAPPEAAPPEAGTGAGAPPPVVAPSAPAGATDDVARRVA